MGKRRKRLTMAKYASKYAKKRAALGMIPSAGVIEIDIASGEETTEEENVKVVTNKTTEEVTTNINNIPEVQPQLQTIDVVATTPVNGLKETKKTTRKTTRKTSTRKASTRKTTTRKKTAKKD